MKRRALTGILAFILAAALTGGCGEEDRGENGEGQTKISSEGGAEVSAVPEETPRPRKQVVFEAVDMEGNSVTSDVFADSKLTMVNVWATYCNPCLREMPELGELASEYSAGDFRLIGIISDVLEGAEQEELDNAAELIEQTEADYTHLLLNRSLYDGLLSDVSALPTTFFVDENGTVLGSVEGAKDKEVWKEIIDELLEEL